MNNYKIDKAGLDFIRQEEGCVLHSYKDAVGVWTLGVGHTGPDVMPGMVITSERAIELLAQDVRKCEDKLNQVIKVPLNQNQVNSCLSFAFNVGVGAFAGSTLLKRINARAQEPLIREAFGRWVMGTINGKKVRLQGLVERRRHEADLFFKASN